MDFDWQVAWNSVPFLLQGAWLTIQLTTIAVFFGIILGTITALLRLTKSPFKYLAIAYTDFMRGTPLLVLIFIIYYGFPPLIQRPIPAYVAAVIALSLNSGAYNRDYPFWYSIRERSN